MDQNDGIYDQLSGLLSPEVLESVYANATVYAGSSTCKCGALVNPISQLYLGMCPDCASIKAGKHSKQIMGIR
jgi:hypothetical protein